MREISLHLLDILTNSVAAGATRISLDIYANNKDDSLILKVTDNGKGMSPDFLRSVTDPFTTTRTTRKVGLGIPLFKEACELCGGKVRIESKQNAGTTVYGNMRIRSIDRLPMGDLGDTFAALIGSYPDRDFVVRLQSDTAGISITSTADIRKRIGNLPITDTHILMFIRDYIREQQQRILGGI